MQVDKGGCQIWQGGSLSMHADKYGSVQTKFPGVGTTSQVVCLPAFFHGLSKVVPLPHGLEVSCICHQH